MRIVCPFTKLDPGTKESLAPFEVDFVEMTTPFSYKELMESIWTKPESIILVEHDSVFESEQMQKLLDCKEHDWCGYAYSEDSPEVSFGLCKLTKEHMQKIPDLWERMKLRNWRDVCAHHGKEYEAIGIKPFQHTPHVTNTGSIRGSL